MLRRVNVSRNWCLVALLAVLLVATGGRLRAGDLDIELIPELDLLGNQIEVIQGYDWSGELALAFGIYDTGASVVSLSATDRMFYEMQGSTVPIKVPDGAVADAVDGVVVGDVSMPMAFWVDGMHAVNMNWSGTSFEMDITYNFTGGVTVPGVQVFVGTETGSAQLPNIAGTPVHFGTLSGTTALPAAKIDMLGYGLDLGEFFADDAFMGPLFQGIVFYLPDISFVADGTRVAGIPDETTNPVRIPLGLFGPENYANPGEEVTVAPNPVVEDVSFQQGLATVLDATMLFDTGAAISVIGLAIAQELGLDLDSPVTTLDIVGAAGSPITVPGFTLDAISLPIDSDFDGEPDGVLRLLNAPVFVLDLVEGLDGILGMNLWNPAKDILYDPYDPLGPSVQMTFLTAARELPPEEEFDPDLLQLLASLDPLMGQMLGLQSGPVYFPRFEIEAGPTGGENVIPEPATGLLMMVGIGALGLVPFWRRMRAKSLAA